MFAYCGNSPITRVDSCGNEWEVVGAGLQVQCSVDFNSASVCRGTEIIIYWNTKETEECGGPIIAIYSYDGRSISTGDVNCIKDLLTESLDLLKMDGANAINALAQSPSISGSASGFVIFGNNNFDGAKSYAGGFNTTTVNIKNVQGFYSWNDKCRAVGAGYCRSTRLDGSKWGISGSKTNYTLISRIPLVKKKRATHS